MKAHELLSSPEKWTHFVAARDSKDNHVATESETACKFCVWGALLRCYGPKTHELQVAIDKLEEKLDTDSTTGIFKWNDDPATTFQEVQQTLKELDI
jgi:hypothetical protein